MKLHLTTADTDCPVEQAANVAMVVMLREQLQEQGIEVESGHYNNADMAIMIASRLHGTGFEAYHQVTSDWDCYKASYQLAAEMQKQVQRYQRVYKREAKAGVVGRGCIPSSAQWLKEIPVPAAVCEYYLNSNLDVETMLPILKTQVKAYLRAIEEWYKQ